LSALLELAFEKGDGLTPHVTDGIQRNIFLAAKVVVHAAMPDA